MIEKIGHAIVYANVDDYAGWPANHGAWQWGDELLVGFLRGRYNPPGSPEGVRGMHYILEPFEKMLARSTDGGRHWTIERPNVDFEAQCVDLTELPIADDEEFIIRCCGVYDTGGDYCNPLGGLYVSTDRGRTWEGAYGFSGIESMFADPYHCTARTRNLGNLVFLSRAERDLWGTDSVFCAELKSDGFHFVGIVCDDVARAVMPAVAEINGRIVAILRRRSSHRRGCWIDAFGSDDGGETWRFLAEVARTGRNNGNPPALVESEGRLVAAYGNRDDGSIEIRTSRDGETWSVPYVLRDGGKTDIGYPQLFARPDGVLVCVYYWAQAEATDQLLTRQHIVATHFRIEE